MAIQSVNNLINSISAGKRLRYDFNKITGASAYTAGRSYDMSNLAGSPVANAWAGTSLAYTACTETTGNGTQIFGMPHGGNVSTDIKHLVGMGANVTAATGVPSTIYLIDIEGYWPNISNNTLSAQTLTGTPSPRSTNGAGLRLFYVQTAVNGATAQNLSLSYTDQSGNTGNALGATVAMTASSVVGHITHSGLAANNYGPFLPLAGGDSGVRNVATITFSAANTGTGALVLCKPLAEIPIGIVSTYHKQDMLGQIPSLPVIPDGACLSMILVAGGAVAASTTFMGHNEFVWG
jgi:hypothetical protein